MFGSAARSKPSSVQRVEADLDRALLRVGRLERREPAHVADVVRRRDARRARGRAASRTSARAARVDARRPASLASPEHRCELAQRDALLLLVARRPGRARRRARRRAPRPRDQLEPVVVELGRRVGVDARRAPRGRRSSGSTASRACAVRSGISSPLNVDPRGEDRVLERVLALGELGRDEPALAGLAQPVEALALVAAGAPSSASRSASSCSRREEVGVARDDLRLLGDLLLADAHRAAFLGALEEVALEAALELGRGADGGDAHRRRHVIRTRQRARPAGGRSRRAPRLERLARSPRRAAALRGEVARAAAGEQRDGQPGPSRRSSSSRSSPRLGADVQVEQDDVDRLGSPALRAPRSSVAGLARRGSRRARG